MNDPHYVKGTKLKRLKLGQLEEEGEEEAYGLWALNEKLVKEAREAIGYLQLDLPPTKLSQNLESEVLVEHGNIAKKA